MQTGVIEGRIDVRAVTDAVRGPEHGAVLTFEGVARNTFEGRAVIALEYEAWAEHATRELAAICAEAEATFAVRAIIVHRTGRVEIEEPQRRDRRRGGPPGRCLPGVAVLHRAAKNPGDDLEA